MDLAKFTDVNSLSRDSAALGVRKVDKTPTRFLLICISMKALEQGNKNLTQIIKTKSQWPLHIEDSLKYAPHTSSSLDLSPKLQAYVKNHLHAIYFHLDREYVSLT